MAEKPEGLDEPTPEPIPDQPADDAPTPAKKPAKKTTRSKLRLSREQWIVVVLLVLTLELGLRAALGSWKRVAATHLILGAIALAILIVRAGLRAATSRTTKTGTDSTSTSRRSRIPGLGRLLGRNTTPNTNSRTAPGGNLRSPFGNLFGGNRPGGAPRGGTNGNSRNPLRNLFGGKRPSGGSHGPGGGGNLRSPFGNLFGGNRPGGAPRGAPRGNRPNGGGPGGGGNRRNPFGNLFGGNRPDQPGRDKKTNPNKPDTKKPPDDKPSKQPKDKPDTSKPKKPDAEKKPDQNQPDSDKLTNPNPTRDEPQREPEGDTPMAHAQTPGIGAPRGNSLHAWGRTLPRVEAALDDLKRRHRILEAEADDLLADVSMLATLGETEHVRNTRVVVAQLQSIAADLRQLGTRPTSEALLKVVGKSATLWTTYLRDCGADEDRIAGRRGTRRQERNADVASAERDI